MAVGLIRRYQITVLSPPSEGSVVRTVIRDNQMTGQFHTNSTGTNASPDLHKLSIYNPSPSDLVALRVKGSKVKVQAGYQYEDGLEIDYDDLKIIFRGEIVKSDITRTPSDTKIDIQLSQGYTELKSATIQRTFTAGTKLTKVLLGFGDTLDIAGFSVRLGPATDFVIPVQQTYNGPTAEVMESFCNQYKLKWYIEDEVIYVVSLNSKGSAKQEEGTFTEVSSRIKGTTSWTVDEESKTGGGESTQVTLNLFLFPQVKLGDSLTLQIEDSDITVVVESVKHLVNFYGDVWDTKIIATSKEVAETPNGGTGADQLNFV